MKQVAECPTANMTGFKNHELRVLIAADIAARGIDVDQLSTRHQPGCPTFRKHTLHRIRTRPDVPATTVLSLFANRKNCLT